MNSDLALAIAGAVVFVLVVGLLLIMAAGRATACRLATRRADADALAAREAAAEAEELRRQAAYTAVKGLLDTKTLESLTFTANGVNVTAELAAALPEGSKPPKGAMSFVHTRMNGTTKWKRYTPVAKPAPAVVFQQPAPVPTTVHVHMSGSGGVPGVAERKTEWVDRPEETRRRQQEEENRLRRQADEQRRRDEAAAKAKSAAATPDPATAAPATPAPADNGQDKNANDPKAGAKGKADPKQGGKPQK